MTRKQSTAIGLVMRQIYNLFEPQLSTQSPYMFKKRRVFAKDALRQVSGSHVTILRAREYLGVEARVIQGKHCWLPPKLNLQEALDKAKRGSKSSMYQVREEKKARYERYASEIAQSLPDIMKHNNYDSSPATIKEDIQLLLGRNYNNWTINMARHKAGIISRRLNDGWHWILPPPDIQGWLENQLQGGPVSYPTLIALAGKNGWSANIINLFRTGYGFAQFKRDKVWFWYDLNTWSPQ